MIRPVRWIASHFSSCYAMWGTYDSLRAAALARAAQAGNPTEQASFCLRCRPAHCCRCLEVLLTGRESRSGLYILDRAHLRKHGVARLLRDPDGGCVHLRDELCSIYACRPQACRDYDCTADGRQDIVWPGA